jgi:catechol 2,3-dioxygenase-like lactoylglutathione lyase family enzyme
MVRNPRSGVCKGDPVLQLTNIVRVDIPVRDRDEAIAFYTETLGFSPVVDNPFGDGKRWVEVAPPHGGVTVALTDPAEVFEPGRPTGIVVRSTDARADHATLESAQVDVSELIGGGGSIPLLFFLRDPSGNRLMVIEDQ